MTKTYILLLLLFVSSCAYVEYGRLPSTIKTAIVGVDDFIIDKQYFDSMDYSFIKVRTGKSSIAIFVLADITDEKYKWVSAEGEILVTINGKIVQLYSDSLSFSFADLNPMRNFFPSSKFVSSLEYILHLDSPKAFLIQQATINRSSLGEIYFLGKAKKVDIFEEKVVTNVLSWNYVNKYWVSDSGLVLQAEQKIHPFLDKTIGIEFYYKY
ncbi:YjbF family lipoprotein [Gammaproteobacteria bacterium]|nr:YjbF family lipoprotein [Gammaproteobacteria bacterium]MDC0128993.1 YjbF family lipoprotein [Gammaproteobacteria bacterium]